MIARGLQRAASGLVNLSGLAPQLLRAEPYYRRIASTIDRDATAAIVSQFANRPEFRDGRKYLRLPLYLRDSVARAVALDLHRSPPLRVLDLGSGAGYFLLACRHFGHDAIGFDLPANEFYRAMFRRFGLARIEGAIRPLADVEGIAGRFDLITAFAVTFAKYRGGEGTRDWGRPEWLHFFADMRRRLTDGGRLFLRLNLLPVRGLRDRSRFDFIYLPVAGFRVRVLSRRELCLTAT